MKTKISKWGIFSIGTSLATAFALAGCGGGSSETTNEIPDLSGLATRWTAQASGTTFTLQDVAWSDTLGRFVVVGAAGTIITSSDGATWTPRDSTVASDLYSVVWNGTQFVAVGGGFAFFYNPEYRTILTSPDGIIWTGEQTTGRALFHVRGDSTGLAAVGNGNNIIISQDGNTWYTTTVPAGEDMLESVTANDDGSQLVAVGASITGGNSPLFTSPDGLTWTSGESGTTASLHSVTSGANKFVTVGDAGAAMTSTDATHWTLQNSGTSGSLNGVKGA